MRFNYYKDRIGEWRWRLIAANNKTISVSNEGYRDLKDCIHSIRLVKSAHNALVVEYKKF